jgi:hypothetical protein
MSDAGFLNFDPSEFVVLEDAIEFDETIQRPEMVRFYTLDEQEVDAFEKLMPQGRTTQFQRDAVKYEVLRMRELYDTYILPTPEDYLLREPETGRRLTWVTPVYATPDRKVYNYLTSWMPLYDAPRAPNFYPRMVSALGHPFAETQEGRPYDFTVVTEFVNADGKKPIRALPVYTGIKGVVHEDKTVEIRPHPIAGTADLVSFVGYHLAKRPLDLPNPLADHPFLKENAESFVESTAPLSDVAPSLDAVLTHAVPVTRDPYREAGPYLKLYDIQLSDIPWSSWKSRFPPVEVESIERERIVIPFPEKEESAPSAKVQEVYQSKYAPGLSPREWLLRQDDGGDFLIRALQSKAIDNGSVESVPGIDLPIPGYPATTLAECSLLGLSFPEFTVKGLLRRSWTIERGKDVITLACVPVEFIRQERARGGYLNRRPWKETTGNELTETQLRALRSVRARGRTDPPVQTESKTPGIAESPLRIQVVAVQQDPKRHARDKLRDIQDLVLDTTISDKVYRDREGSFVVCSHTLAVLGGDFEANRPLFYDTWTAPVDGFRVCKFCGERIGGVDLVDQDEYDEGGFLVKRSQALPTGPSFSPTMVQEYVTGLRGIAKLFDMTNAVDATLFTILSLLQVLPTAEAVDQVLKMGRDISQGLGKETDTILQVKGTLGIALAALLLQTHIPALIPRRSFGSKPLKLDGYPRDAAEPEAFSILESIMLVIENTFRAYPTSLSGPIQQVVRKVIAKPKEIRKNAIVFLNAKLLKRPGVREMLDKSKADRAAIPILETPTALLPVVLPPATLGTVTQFVPCPSLRPILEGKNPPRYRQPAVPLRTGLQATRSRVNIPPATSVRVAVADVPTAEIRRRLAFERASSGAKLPVKDAYRTNLVVASRLADLMLTPTPIREVNLGQKASELRDLSRGLLFEELAAAAKSPQTLAKVNEAVKKDIALFCLMSDYKEQKAEAQKVRAVERMTYVQRMAQLSDQEREVNMELAKRGMAPILITIDERTQFARESEEESSAQDDIGVGLPQDTFEQGESNAAGTNNGNYGDYAAVPTTEGRDYPESGFVDFDERSI